MSNEFGAESYLNTYNLPNYLSSRLNTSPGRNILAFDDLRSRRGHLFDEAFVGHDATIEVDFDRVISGTNARMGSLNYTYDSHQGRH